MAEPPTKVKKVQPCVGVMPGLKHLFLSLAVAAGMAPSASWSITEAEAARFLTQATFGPTPSEVKHLQAIGYEAWIDEQLAMPAVGPNHQEYWDQRHQAIIAKKPGSRAGPGELVHSFWAHALTGPDQLRQRMAFALSEIFVVSWADNCVDNNSRGASNYLDILDKHAFDQYRTLLEAVTLHPVMGCYLSHLKNQREDESTGRVPDENFARELMQLFSIGLYQLNSDGSNQLDANGHPIETYSPQDISGLAKVMTGWSWDCSTWPSDTCFIWGDPTNDGASTGQQYVSAMKPYAKYHSRSEKQFLGIRIAPQPFWPDATGDLQIALDKLASHPNVGPFIGRQLIQRFITSNPSSTYVARVTAAFDRSGGSLGQTMKAILLDPEARDANQARYNPRFGKVREPILKLSAMLRGIGVKSKTGRFLMPVTDDAGTSLNQAPLKAPTVFNFFRPGYVPPGSEAAKQGMVAPELQLVQETSVAGYVNFMRDVQFAGLGAYGFDNTERESDVQLAFNVDPDSDWLRLTAAPNELVEALNQRLMYDSMPDKLRTEIVNAVKAIPPEMKLVRVRSAVLLTVASPSFQVQK